MRKSSWKSIVAVMLIAAFVGSPALATGDYEPQAIQPPAEVEATGPEMLADVVLIRPVSFFGLLMGSVTWLVAAPLAAIADGKEGFNHVSQALVVEPFHYTFNRSVGEEK